MSLATTAEDNVHNNFHDRNDEDDHAAILRRIAWRPADLDRAMIRINDAPKFGLVDLPERPASFGALAKLPLEIAHMVLNFLDLKSISRVSRVSAHGLFLVQSLPAYHEITQHAPSAVGAFARSGLLAVHPITQVRRALWSSRCECCPEYGPFLFLPTCVRCCWECLRLSPSLRAISPGEIKRYFGLKESHVAKLPALHTIPGDYIFSHKNRHMRESKKLISATTAKELALTLHGSTEGLSDSLTRRLKASGSRAVGRFMQGASSMPQCVDSLAVPFQGNVPPDDYFGMASLPLPFLHRSGDVENGLWCRGCLFTFEHYRQFDRAIVESLVPSGCGADRVLHGMSRRAWSKAGLLEHVKRCYGVKRLTCEQARE